MALTSVQLGTSTVKERGSDAAPSKVSMWATIASMISGTKGGLASYDPPCGSNLKKLPWLPNAASVSGKAVRVRKDGSRVSGFRV